MPNMFTDNLTGNAENSKGFSDYFTDNVADIGYGAKKALSGATFGASDWALRKLGLDNEQEYLRHKRAEGLGGLTKGLGLASEIGGNILGAGGALVKGLQNLGWKGYGLAGAAGGVEGAAYGLTGSDRLADAPENLVSGAGFGAALPIGLGYGAKWVARPITNSISHYVGKRKLANQLRKGFDFDDVFLGNIDDDLATKLNQVRIAENVSPVDNTSVTIPTNNVSHIFNRRVVKNKYTPDETGKTLNNALFSRNSHVIKGKTPDYQVILDDSSIPNAAIISKDKSTNGVMVKTGYRAEKSSNLSKNYQQGNLAGTGNPASTPIQQNRSAASISTLQVPFGTSNITPNTTGVNQALRRSFVESLADKNKCYTMQHAVMSGAEDLSERAKILSEHWERQKNGIYDADFEQVVKIPELRRAEENYARFILKNSSRMVPKEKVVDFYTRHPASEDIMAEKRLIDPQTFESIKPGSLAEFDMLKKILREEAGNKIKVGVSKSSVLKLAENDLKQLMEKEFPGFRDVNRNFTDAQIMQEVFESKLKKGLNSVGGATALPFWNGISGLLTAAGVIGGYFNPAVLALTAAGLGGKALLRNARRNAGRRLADGIIRTPVNINPVLTNGLSAPALNALSKYQNRQDD